MGKLLDMEFREYRMGSLFFLFSVAKLGGPNGYDWGVAGGPEGATDAGGGPTCWSECGCSPECGMLLYSYL